MPYIIAVGYELGLDAIDEFKKNVVDMFEKKTNSQKTLYDKFPEFNLENFVFQPQIYSGIFYRTPPAGDDDCRKTEEELKTWYGKHQNDENIFIDSFYYYYSKKKMV